MEFLSLLKQMVLKTFFKHFYIVVKKAPNTQSLNVLFPMMITIGVKLINVESQFKKVNVIEFLGTVGCKIYKLN